MKNSSGDLVGSFKFQRMGCQAGGYMTGLQAADDGRLISRGDVMCAHIRDIGDTQWRPLVRPGDNYSEANYQANGFARGSGGGCYACAIHPTNSNIMAALEHGLIWLTTDGGATVSITGYPQNDVVNSNEVAGRTSGGARMAFDPNNPTGQILAVVDDGGLKYTTNGGATWSTNAGVPAPNAARVYGIVVFDRSSTVVSNATQTVYVFSYGNGVYRSTTGISGTFSLIASSPTTAISLRCDSGGKIHIAGDGQSSAQYRYWTSGGGWVAPAGVSALSVAINRSNSNQIYLLGSGGNLLYSSDNGVSFTAANTHHTPGGNEVVWRITTNWLGASCSDMVWVPTLSRLVCCDGFGLFCVDSPPTDSTSSYVLKEYSLGLDLVILMSIDIMPTGAVLAVAQDHHWFQTTFNDAAKPFKHSDGIEWERVLQGTPTLATNGNAGGCDWFASAPSCWAVASVNNISAPGPRMFLTQDAGLTWAHVTPPTGLALGNGNVALGYDGTKYIMIWLPSNQDYPRYLTSTTIAGFTSKVAGDWQTLTLDATYTTTIGSGWHQANYVARRCLVSDKNHDGTFYVFNDGNGLGDAADLAMRGLWRVVFSGGTPTATRVKNTVFTSYPYDFWHGKFRLNPLNSAHQFWCIGDSSPTNAPVLGKQIQFSSNDWATQSTVGPSGTGAGTFTEVYDYAFGKAAPGKSYPTIYAIGWKIGTPNVWGLFWCRDFNPASPTSATWELTKQFPLNVVDRMSVLAADMNKFGRVYVGVGQQGGLVMDYGETFTAS